MRRTEPKNRRLISVVIPAYNEEDNVWNAYSQIKSVFENQLTDYDFEIVFTDNCSKDNTLAELEKIASQDNRVRVASFVRNYGFNKSLLTGFRLARGDAAIQLDCDLQDPPQIFPEFIKRWEQGYDVVVGLREKRPEPKFLLALRKTFYRFLSRISEDNLVVDGGDFRLLDKSILDQLREMHVATPYVRGLVSTLASNQTGFAYQRQKRQHGQSKFPIVNLIGLAIDGIVSHSTLPLRLASIFGFLVAIATVLFALGYIIAKVAFGLQMPDGFATSIILELLSIGLNAIFLGIIGEYLSRIHQQLRQVPITVIQKSFNLDRGVENRSASPNSLGQASSLSPKAKNENPGLE